MKFKHTLLLAMLISLCLTAVTASAEIKLGILPRLGAMQLTTMFTPLANYLSAETGEKVTLVIPKNFDAFKAEAKAGAFQLGFSNPLIYVQVKKHAGLDPLALATEPKAGAKFRGIIVARKDGGIEKVQDLKGKKLVFVDRNSAAGYIFQMLLLSKAGLDIDKDFTTLPFVNKHDNVMMAVFNKTADAGGIREDDWDKMRDKVDLSQMKIVAYSDYFPNWPLFSTHTLNNAAAAKVKAALLKLTPGDPQSEKVLGPAKLSGFVTVTDKDYDMLRQAAVLVGAM